VVKCSKIYIFGGVDMPLINCPDCSTKNEKDSIFCEKCGLKLDENFCLNLNCENNTKPRNADAMFLIYAVRLQH